jgi:hypothetical protein
MTALAPQLITVENQTSEGVLTAKELFNLVWALNYQAAYHYGRSPWVELGYAPSAHVVLLPHDGQGVVKPPAGAWNLILLDTSTVAGALGYHEDEQGNKIPFSDVFVKTARENQTSPVEVASHEMLEMLVDPDVAKVRTVTHEGQLYIVEVADPVQGCGYDVGKPESRETGVIVADFALPAWFGMAQEGAGIDDTAMSFRNSVSEPFTLAPGGYISVAPESEPEQWKQIFGRSSTSELPQWASRLPRIHKL